MKEDALESKVEADILKAAVRLGWLCWKFISPGHKGVPDRILMRRGRVIFLEVKKWGEEPTTQQNLRAAEIRKAGVEVFWVDNLEDALVILA